MEVSAYQCVSQDVYMLTDLGRHHRDALFLRGRAVHYHRPHPVTTFTKPPRRQEAT